MNNGIIRYEVGQWITKPVFFEFTLDECLKVIEKRKRDAHDDLVKEYTFISNVLLERCANEEIANISYKETELHRFIFVAAELLYNGSGKTICPHCGKVALGYALGFEKYERGRPEVLMGGGGRRFYCKSCQNILFDVTDWRA